MKLADTPAFPVPAPDGSGYYSGITVRQWLAGMAMQGMISCSHDNCPHDTESVVRYSLQFADALIIALETSPHD